MNVKELIESRFETHGDFENTAKYIQTLKCVMRNSINWPDNLTAMQRESLEMIVHKIGRILSGDPNCKDHWNDIAGYATLIGQFSGDR